MATEPSPKRKPRIEGERLASGPSEERRHRIGESRHSNPPAFRLRADVILGGLVHLHPAWKSWRRGWFGPGFGGLGRGFAGFWTTRRERLARDGARPSRSTTEHPSDVRRVVVSYDMLA